MRRALLVLALLLVGCGDDDDTGYQGISDVQEANLVAQCIAARPETPACVSYVAEVVAKMEANECPYPEVARAVSYGLTPERDRGELVLDCPKN